MSRALVITACVIGSAVTALTTIAWLLQRAQRRKRSSSSSPPPPPPPPPFPSDAWQPLGTLSEIALYPLKSGAALALPAAHCDQDGLKTTTTEASSSSSSFAGLRDRRLWLLNDEGKVASAGCYPSMLAIRITHLSDEILRFDAKDVPAPLTIDVKQLQNGSEVTMSKTMPDGYRQPLIECDVSCHEWFSEAILQRPKGMRLYVALQPTPPIFKFNRTDSFMPIMAMHDKSMDDLNARLERHSQAAVHHRQFRGNLLISSRPEVAAYDEDNWLWLRIGGYANGSTADDDRNVTILRFNSFCRRCIIVNIDVQHGKRNAHFEPLRTLRGYRLLGHPREPVMGTYFDVYKAGCVRHGDMVYVHRQV